VARPMIRVLGLHPVLLSGVLLVLLASCSGASSEYTSDVAASATEDRARSEQSVREQTQGEQIAEPALDPPPIAPQDGEASLLVECSQDISSAVADATGWSIEPYPYSQGDGTVGCWYEDADTSQWVSVSYTAKASLSEPLNESLYAPKPSTCDDLDPAVVECTIDGEGESRRLHDYGVLGNLWGGVHRPTSSGGAVSISLVADPPFTYEQAKGLITTVESHVFGP
jgi:hypothetical protein